MASRWNLPEFAMQVSDKRRQMDSERKIGVHKERGDNLGQHCREHHISAPAAHLPQEPLFPEGRNFASASFIHYCRTANTFFSPERQKRVCHVKPNKYNASPTEIFKKYISSMGGMKILLRHYRVFKHVFIPPQKLALGDDNLMRKVFLKSRTNLDCPCGSTHHYITS